ncbi:putative transcriptional regulator [Bacillus sp. TS-2]|nr:putative transcriptional regulator [Bacillus sp. TS-2]
MTKLKKILTQRGLKQNYIAQKIGVAPGTISQIVKGESMPTLTVALKIAYLLDMKVEEIWEETIAEWKLMIEKERKGNI